MLVAALALSPVAATPALGAEVTAELRSRLAAAAPAETVRAIVTLEGVPAGPASGAGAEAVIRSARAATARAAERLDLPRGARVTARHWVAGAVSVEGPPDAIRALAGAGGVEAVDADPRVRILGARRTAVGLDAASGNWGLAAIAAPRAWESLGRDGAGVRVGSIDTGVSASHPALAGKVAAWRDFVAGRPEPYDDNGHGTHTIGTMVGGAAGGAAIGVAPGARVVVAKAQNSAGWGTGSALLAAGQWMTDPDGDPATPDFPAVINSSWGAAAAQSPWYREMVRTWRRLGIVPVFAAGNSGPGPSSVMSPASYPESIAVGALDRSSTPAGFSARGPVTWEDVDGSGPAAGTVLAKPDLSAPGVGITSAVEGGYAAYSGTSMAAPHVAGVVALMRQANPAMGVDEIAAALRETAADVHLPGADPGTGAGRVDAPGAVSRAAGVAAPDVAPPPPRPPAAEPPPAPAGPAPAGRGGTVRLSVGQLLINQRIAQAAVRRVNEVLARLGEDRRTSRSRDAASDARVRMSRSQLLINQRISQAAVRRAHRARLLLAGRPAGAAPAGGAGGDVRLSAAQLLINQRISQAAIRRANDLLAATDGMAGR